MLALALLASRVPVAAGPPPPLPELPPLLPTDRVLVIAPHPDDETLCCAGLLQRAVQSGAAPSSRGV